MKKAPMRVLFSALSLAKNLTVNIGAIAQFFTWFKVRNVFPFQIHFIAGLRITSGAWCAVMQREAAETADFNTLALRKSRGHMFQHLFNCIFNRFRGNGWTCR